MQVTYCDLCSAPLKEENYFMLFITAPTKSNFDTESDYYNYMSKIRREVKEICPSCRHIFNKIFELKLQRLVELTDEINNIYDLPSKKNPKERKNDKGDK